MKKVAKTMKKEPPEDEKSSIFDGRLFEITLSANCNNVEKMEPQKREFGEILGIKIGLRSKNFLFKIDIKIELIFIAFLKRFLYDLVAQDGAKMAPRQRQDEAKMALRWCFKSSIVSGGVQDPSGPRFSWIWDPPGRYF